MWEAWPSFKVILFIVASLTVLSAKRNYRIEFEGVHLIRDPKFLVQLDYCRVSKFNQTTYTFNLAGNWTEPCPLDAYLTVTAYQKMGNNAYSKIPVVIFSGPFKDFFLKDMFVMPSLVNASSFGRIWPIPKGFYTITDFVMDPDLLPDEVPGERWQADFLVSNKRQIIFRMKIDAFIDRDN